MKDEELKKQVENAIISTFRILANTVKVDKVDTKGEIVKVAGEIEHAFIRYPKISGKEQFRVSEQEGKQIFIHELWNRGISFSVETPTSEKYRFWVEGSMNPKQDDSGRAAQVDVSVYNGKEIAHHIEFKANNPGIDNIAKDVLKLVIEGDNQSNYFVQILESIDSGTLPNVIGKYKESLKKLNEKTNNHVTFYIMNHALTRSTDKYKGYWIFTDSELKEMDLTPKDKDYYPDYFYRLP